MELENKYTKLSALIETKVRSLVSGQNPVYSKPLFRVKSLKPLNIQDGDGVVVSCQSDAPKNFYEGDTISLDDFTIDLQLANDNKIKIISMTAKTLLYGINQVRKERGFSGRFNLAPALKQQNKIIAGCLNALRKQKISKAFSQTKTEVLSLVGSKTSRKKSSNQLVEESKEATLDVDRDDLAILKKLSKTVSLNDLFRAAMQHPLKQLDSRRVVRMMAFPNEPSEGDLRNVKKTFDRQIIRTLLDEYKR